ncbi:YIP1 family protein [Halorussus salilacus]|uniref:Yip1 family protein n=1 Tax=Halorussus salilacus TaxID=2953750 RepID=UPI00209DFFD3|nr:YIP1 family protein [Halorussus salilacus]USZ66945.1 YIP1 family protein [Halorussus salilacus]
MSFIRDIRELCVNPDEFYRTRGDDPSLRKPVLIVFGVALLNIFSSVLLISHVRVEGQSLANTFLAVSGIFGSIFGVVGIFILWLLFTAVFYALSIAFDGSGTFRQLFRFVGWGYFPAGFSAIASLVLTWYAIQSVPAGLELQAFIQEYQSHPALEIASIVGVVILAWQALIWVFAVHHARNITLREAGLVVAIPTAANIAWNAFQLL